MSWNRRDLLVVGLPAIGWGLTARAVWPNGPGDDCSLDTAGHSRLEAAEAARLRGCAPHAANGDEDRVPDLAGSFSKTLPHDALGRVDPTAYRIYRQALGSREPSAFERVPLGGYRKLADPQAAYSFELVGPSPEQIACPPAPRFDSAEQAAEMVELYWQALLRDVPFSEYEGHPLVQPACEDLDRCEGFAGPRDGVDEPGRVTSRSLFRGTTEGDLRGPYVSQFLLQPVPFRPTTFQQRMQTAAAGQDYLMGYQDWLHCQNGGLTSGNRLEDQPRFICNGRDLGEYVHRDFTYQAYLAACLMLLRWGAPVDGGNPYKHSHTQGGFATFGAPFTLSLVATSTQLALKAAWYQKWLVHRRLRPEAYGGRVHNQRIGASEYPIHPALLESAVLERLPMAAPRRGEARTWLLPLAYPEGSPAHPSYPAGHAVIAGACVTVLKALFDESFEIPQPVEPSPDGKTLHRFTGARLTVGGELDKLASNISLGRDFAGVHYRSDASSGLAMGEEIAVRLLDETRYMTPGIDAEYTFTAFDGRQVKVS